MTTLTPSRLAEIEALVPWLRNMAEAGAKALNFMAASKTTRNRAAGDLNSDYGIMTPQQTQEWKAAEAIYELLASHAALAAEVERLRGQLLVCREAGKMLSGALTSSEDQREAALDRIWDSINAHGGTFEADDLEGKGKCEMIDKALAIIEKEGGVGEVQRLSLKTKEEADDE